MSLRFRPQIRNHASPHEVVVYFFRSSCVAEPKPKFRWWLITLSGTKSLMEQYSLVSEITSLSILHEGMGGVGGEGGEGGSHYKDKTALATLQPSLFLFDDIP